MGNFLTVAWRSFQYFSTQNVIFRVINTEKFSTRFPNTSSSTCIQRNKILFFLDFLIELRYVFSTGVEPEGVVKFGIYLPEIVG